MKVVIDTNVLISAALKDRNPEKAVLLVAFNQDWEWIVSVGILREYQEVLTRRRLNISEQKQSYFLYLLKALTTLVEADIKIDFPRDRKDTKFLACAVGYTSLIRTYL